MSVIKNLVAQHAAQNKAAEMSLMGGHSGARWSSKRNYIYYPHVQSDRAIDSWTRSELIRKSCWVYDEISWVGGMIDRAASMCSKISQKSTTNDKEWNSEADAALERVWGSPESFDLAGKHSWKGLVKAFFKGKFRVGDDGMIMAVGEDGGAKIKFVEGFSIGDNPEASDDDRWTDGLLLDAHGKALSYRVLDGDGGSVDYDRSDFIFFCAYDKPGQNRGVPKTYRMLTKVQDQAEVEGFWMGGIKAASEVAMTVVNSKTDGGPSGIGSALSSSRQSFKGKEKNEIYRQDLDSSSKLLEMGDERIELLHDKRPAPDQVNYLDYQKRDCAAGFGLPIEVIWNWGGAGGALTRTLLSQQQDFIDEEQEMFIEQVAVRVRLWVLSLEMEAGRLRRCNDAAWWQHSWMYGARKTADFAKDGRIYLEALNRGELSPDRYHAMQNQDVDREDAVTIARWKKRKDLCEASLLDVNYVFPPAPGTPVSPDVAEILETVRSNDDE